MTILKTLFEEKNLLFLTRFLIHLKLFIGIFKIQIGVCPFDCCVYLYKNLWVVDFEGEKFWCTFPYSLDTLYQ